MGNQLGKLIFYWWTNGVGQVSKRIGIPEHIRADHGPEMVGKLPNELVNGEIFYTLRETQVLIEQWRVRYNSTRPHCALGYRLPDMCGVSLR